MINVKDTTVYLCFHSMRASHIMDSFSGYTPWWRWWMEKFGTRFSHVAGFWFDRENQCWLMIDWPNDGTRIGIIDPGDFDSYIAALTAVGSKFLMYRPSRTPNAVPHWNLCTSGAAHFANIRHWGLTPDNLYRALLRNGAEPSFELSEVPLSPKEKTYGRSIQQAEVTGPGSGIGEAAAGSGSESQEGKG